MSEFVSYKRFSEAGITGYREDGTAAFIEPAHEKWQEALAEAGPYVPPPEPTPEEILEAKRAAASLDRMTFALRAAEAGYVTYDAAAQWAAGNSAPPPLQAAIDALPEAERGPALVQVLGAANIRRNNKLMPLIIAAFETDDAGADALYGIE